MGVREMWVRERAKKKEVGRDQEKKMEKERSE